MKPPIEGSSDDRVEDRTKNTQPTRKQVLTIAGSDSGGGAGIQGDIKAIEANGAYAMSVLTSVTAQNTIKMTATFDLPLWLIEAQMKAVFEDFDVSAVKTGMLASKVIVKRVSDLLKQVSFKHLVVDPIMTSKTGHALLQPDALSVLISDLIPMATLLTPNVPEAERLANTSIHTIADGRRAAEKIKDLGCRAVLIKGGHLPEAPGCDILFDGKEIRLYEAPFFDTPHTHGTGCTFSAAIAAQLAIGKPLHRAVSDAKRYVGNAIRHPLGIGHGQGPTNHFYFLDEMRPN
ncbi:MAG: bifunctional hydroxymethylpyrimidine kinase/phosphomethylpyrimidine kinase [Nitrospiria bacterium]